MWNIFVNITGKLISDLIFIIMIFEQVMLTTFSWMTINCFNILPTFIIIETCLAFFGTLVFSVSVLRLILYVRINSEELLGKKNSQYFGYNRTNGSYYYTTKWRAQKEIQVSCGSYFAISKNAVNILIDVMNTNITNAVFLIIP